MSERIELEIDDSPVELTAAQRRLLARLAVDAPRAVGFRDLISAMWEGDPPASARAAMQNQVSRIRAASAATVIETTSTGYLLNADVDLHRAHRIVGDSEQALPADPGAALDLIDRLELPEDGDIPAFSGSDDVRALARELRSRSHEVEIRATLALGLRARALAVAERLANESPYDEHRWGLLARALDAAGRRGDALSAVSRIRRSLRADLGLEIGSELVSIEAAILASGIASRRPAVSGFLGRERELDAALAILAASGTATVVGEPGIGVSRLLTEARAALVARGGRVAFVRVHPNPDTALSPLTDLLSELGIDPTPALGALAGFVPAVTAIAESAPVTLIVDDLHLAGPSTRTALREAAALDCVAVLAGSHDGEHSIGEPIRLSALSDSTVGRIARMRVPSIDDAAVAWLARITGGNPLYVESVIAEDELLSTLTDTGGVHHLPESIAALARERIRELPSATRNALDAAAVAGGDTPIAAFEAMGFGAGIDDGVRWELLDRSPRGTIDFRHGALARIVYSDLSVGHRHELHHAFAVALRELGSPAGAIARHALAAASIDSAGAIAAATAAAASASQLGAHHDAVTLLESAAGVAALVDARTLLDVDIQLGDAMRLAGDPQHVDLLTDAAARAETIGADDLLGRAVFSLLQLGGTSVTTHVDPRIDALLTRTLDALRDPDLRAAVSAAASLAFSMTGNAERSRDHFLLADSLAVGSETRRQVLPLAYLGLGLPSDIERRAALAEELIALSRAADDTVGLFEGLHLDASVALQIGDGRRLRLDVNELRDLIDSVGDVGRRWALHYLDSAIAHLDDQLELAERRSAEAMALFAPVSESRAVATHSQQMLPVLLAAGRIAALEPGLTAMLDAQPGVPAWHAALALAVAESNPERALRHAGITLEVIQPDFTWLAAHVAAGRAVAIAARSVDDPAARALAGRYRDLLVAYSGRGCWAGTCSYGPVDTVLALLARACGDADSEARHSAAARAFAESLQAPVFLRDLDQLGL